MCTDRIKKNKICWKEKYKFINVFIFVDFRFRGYTVHTTQNTKQTNDMIMKIIKKKKNSIFIK